MTDTHPNWLTGSGRLRKSIPTAWPNGYDRTPTVPEAGCESTAFVFLGIPPRDDGDVVANEIESLWALFKRAYWSTWHWVSHSHLQRYLNEITGRLNQRRLSTLEAMGEIVRGMDGKRLTYQHLTADI